MENKVIYCLSGSKEWFEMDYSAAITKLNSYYRDAEKLFLQKKTLQTPFSELRLLTTDEEWQGFCEQFPKNTLESQQNIEQIKGPGKGRVNASELITSATQEATKKYTKRVSKKQKQAEKEAQAMKEATKPKEGSIQKPESFLVAEGTVLISKIDSAYKRPPVEKGCFIVIPNDSPLIIKAHLAEAYWSGKAPQMMWFIEAQKEAIEIQKKNLDDAIAMNVFTPEAIDEMRAKIVEIRKMRAKDFFGTN